MIASQPIAEQLTGVYIGHENEVFIWDSQTGNPYTYQEFFSRVASVAELFSSKGLKAGDVICTLLPNCFQLTVIYFAALLRNLVIAPLDPRKGTVAIAEIVRQLKPKLFFNVTAAETTTGKRCVTLAELTTIANSRPQTSFKPECFLELDYAKPFLISFTSGTTGISKGIVHSAGNLLSSARAFQKLFEFNANHVFYHNLPMSYMAGILNLIILPFVSNSKIVLGDMFSATTVMNFWEKPVRYNVNTFWFTPTIVSFLLQLDRGNTGMDFGRKNKIVGCIGTAPLAAKHRVMFEEKYQIPLFESYGLTETLFVASQKPGDDRFGNVGKLLEDVQVRFAADREIFVQVPWQFCHTFVEGAAQNNCAKEYPSGDLGEISPEGFLRITGRKKDIIIRGGVNLYPGEIEQFLAKEAPFVECVVLGVPNDLLGEKTVCFFKAPAGGVTSEQLRETNQKIRTAIGVNHCIDQFQEVAELPRNLNGKIDKIKIRNEYKV